MTPTNNKELVRRIARLARQNRELEEQVRTLKKINDSLTEEIGKDKTPSQQSSREVTAREPVKKEKNLKFNTTTVLFAAIRYCSMTLEEIDSTAVLDELDEIFYEFGVIAERYKIEKIKSIGDTFMCAGGLPVKNITNPVDVVMAAVEMTAFLDRYELKKREDGQKIWDLKIGVHTGSVTATLSGKKKITYDIKGDTVNFASRIRDVPGNGSILISVMTNELVKEFFDTEYFGKLPVKYHGALEIYGVSGLKPELSTDTKGSVPNEAFRTKFGLIQFTDIQEIILDKLEKELPGNLFYHNVKHTVDVVTEVELIGWAEGCTDEEILLLKTAGLFHDAGFPISYENHEYYGARIAKEMLPSFNYSQEQIDRICSIIMATKLPPRPANLLEEIICDSDLDYLGRSDFIPVSNALFEELKAQGKMSEINEWNKMQVRFISGHQYFTKTARNLREVNKQQQIERIQSLIR